MQGTANEQRAERAYRCVIGYGDDGDIESAITDLMVDLLHLSKDYSHDPEALHARIWRHYVAERDDDA